MRKASIIALRYLELSALHGCLPFAHNCLDLLERAIIHQVVLLQLYRHARVELIIPEGFFALYIDGKENESLFQQNENEMNAMEAQHSLQRLERLLTLIDTAVLYRTSTQDSHHTCVAFLSKRKEKRKLKIFLINLTAIKTYRTCGARVSY